MFLKRLVLSIQSNIKGYFRKLLTPVVLDIVTMDFRVFGPANRLHHDKTAKLANTLFNTISGEIYIGRYAFFGHNVTVVTGSHDYKQTMRARQEAIPISGRDIWIEEGAWIGSNAVIVGPCRIGKNAVVAAGAVVIRDVPDHTIVAGVPSRTIGTVPQ